MVAVRPLAPGALTCAQVQHKTSWGELKETSPWLKAGQPLTIGVTSGASTPDRDVEDILERIFKIVDPSFETVAPREDLVPARSEHSHDEEV